MGSLFHRTLKPQTRNTIWFGISFAGAILNGIWFEVCNFFGVMNWFALALFILFFVHAIHYANAR